MGNISLIEWGRPVPWFHAATQANPRFNFASLGGRFILLAFLGDGRCPAARTFIDTLAAAGLPQNGQQFVAFAVSLEERDQQDEGVGRVFSPARVFHDPDGQIAISYGVAERSDEGLRYSGGWYLIDPMMRVYRKGSLQETDKLLSATRSLPRAEDHAVEGQSPWAPVLMVPRVLTPGFCEHLIDLYRQGAPNPSGFMRELGGRTVPIMDTTFKRRSDMHINDAKIRNMLNNAIAHRLKPEVMKAFQFNATRIERYIIARYGAEEKGFFKRHRDNTTSGTAHRRFAVSINLNAEGHDGGELCFPEFGTRTYKPPTGGAVVFSCSLLHEATPVTKGERFATLPFLYDDEAAKIRVQNRDKIDSEMLVVGDPP
ncbi:2OG-Fe(II) oxygenase [Kordiimonas lacus]|uniref:AhpC/TSA family protein n=1 Tax=Kordiimonas lacus TaxID=637679 RepID=A0A1G6ZGF3_9PROT|nr:2OG-Fe(II) oxygenase [Kordiimonas lacus]SDE01764.1 AhpC/TSA family protein [Kordiimonas lacus]